MLRNPILLAAAMLLASSAALSQETSRPAAAASAPEAGSSSKVIRPPIDGAMTPAKPAYPVQAGQGQNHGAPQRQSAIPAPLPPIDMDAMNEMLQQQASPLQPRQIKAFRNRIDRSLEATNEPLRRYDPKTQSFPVSVEPGQKYPELSAVKGLSTNIGYFDSTGEPWEIDKVVMADPKLIFADVPQAHGNYVVVVPLTSYGETDISVYLMDLSVPITVRLTFGEGDSYYQRADIRVAKRGPKAKPLLIDQPLPEQGDKVIMGLLDGVAPPSAVALRVDSPSSRAWRIGETVYLRTNFSVLSPAWTGSVTGPGGVTVYALPDTPVVLISDNGRMSQIRIDGPIEKKD